MISRCHRKRDRNYENYGARGIHVCDRWGNSFEAFFEDMGVCPDGMSIERSDVNKGYEPSNCRWATRLEQARNTRRTVTIQIECEPVSLADFAEQHGIDYDAAYRAAKRIGITGKKYQEHPQ